MENTLINRKQGYILILITILVGLSYQLLPYVFLNVAVLEIVGMYFNVVIMFIVLLLLLKNEFLDWFKHFSFKWLLIGIPFLFIVGLLVGRLWSIMAGGHTGNSVENVLSWSYVIKHIPFMLMGEELLSIAVLYAAWKKLGWKFWQATLLCSVLFAVWHLPAYDYNLLQCLFTIIPSRLILNYLFKKSNSVWVTWLVHMSFDIISFLPILLR